MFKQDIFTKKRTNRTDSTHLRLKNQFSLTQYTLSTTTQPHTRSRKKYNEKIQVLVTWLLSNIFFLPDKMMRTEMNEHKLCIYNRIDFSKFCDSGYCWHPCLKPF
jgi:hypothetical protein